MGCHNSTLRLQEVSPDGGPADEVCTFEKQQPASRQASAGTLAPVPPPPLGHARCRTSGASFNSGGNSSSGTSCSVEVLNFDFFQHGDAPSLGSSPCGSKHGGTLAPRDRTPEEAARVPLCLIAADPPGTRFACVTSLLRNALSVPLAFVCLLDEHEAVLSQPLGRAGARERGGAAWVPLGLDEARAMCGPACSSAQVVEDMRQDARFASFSFVSGPPHLAFLASAPLASGDGSVVYGAVVVADTKPHSPTPVQLEALGFVAASVARDIERAEQRAQHAQQGSAPVQGGSERTEADHQGAGALRVECGAQQALLRRCRSLLDGQAEAMLALDVSHDSWPVLFANKAAALSAGLLLHQPSGVPFWHAFALAPGEGSGGVGGGQGPHGSASEGVGAPSLARHLFAAGEPFSLTCQLQASGVGAQLCLLPEGSATDSPFTAPLGTWAEAGGPEQSLPSPLRQHSVLRGSVDTAMPGLPAPRHAVQAAALGGRASLDTALAAMQRGGRRVHRDSTFHVTFAPCTPQLLHSLRAAARATLGSGGGTSAAGGSDSSLEGCPATPGRDGFEAADAAPPCWLATLRPQPALSSASLRRASSDCSAGLSRDELFLRPEQFRDVRIGPLLGAGAFGRTYCAMWQGQRIAVKIVRCPCEDKEAAGPPTPCAASEACVGDDSPLIEALLSKCLDHPRDDSPLTEALLSKSLDHPHIVATHGFGVCQGPHGGREVWVLQELCSRGTLSRAVERGAFQLGDSRQPNLRYVLQTAAELVGALAFLHSKSLVHADINGNNVLLNRSDADGRGFVAMLADFGLSRPLDLQTSVSTGTFGTVSHMPPELVVDGRLSPAVDCYGAGVLIWEMMSGQRAWAGMSMVQVISSVAIRKEMLPIPGDWPEPIKALVARCLSHDPQARPTAKDLLAELLRLLDLEGGGCPATDLEQAACGGPEIILE